jgi:hypothetical protein
VWVDGAWTAAAPLPQYPTQAPPPPRVENVNARRGFIWVRGRWEWNGSDWAWTPGHYERERAGYIYREPRWEQRDGVYVKIDGTWVVR